MKTQTSPAETQVGILLASGFTKKEVASKLHKSVRTIDRQSDNLYKKTGCRNLADITRFMIRRYSGLPIEDILINAAHDFTVIAGAAFLTWCAFQPETMDNLSTALSTVANFLTK